MKKMKIILEALFVLTAASGLTTGCGCTGNNQIQTEVKLNYLHPSETTEKQKWEIKTFNKILALCAQLAADKMEFEQATKIKTDLAWKTFFESNCWNNGSFSSLNYDGFFSDKDSAGNPIIIGQDNDEVISFEFFNLYNDYKTIALDNLITTTEMTIPALSETTQTVSGWIPFTLKIHDDTYNFTLNIAAKLTLTFAKNITGTTMWLNAGKTFTHIFGKQITYDNSATFFDHIVFLTVPQFTPNNG